jgi:hypothetical protein
MDEIHKARALVGGCIVLLAAAILTNTAWAHGGVVAEEDLCTIYIGFYKAHFKAYQPRTRQQQAFCEDLPDVGETVFVMEYVHGDLGQAPMEFRIIKDVTGHGRYATLEDVTRAGNLDRATVYYRPPAVTPDVFTVVHQFDKPGWYIGIVTVRHPTLDKTYTAVFPFEVGFTGFGWLPLIGAIAVVAQGGYWLSTGQFSRWRKRWAAATLGKTPEA